MASLEEKEQRAERFKELRSRLGMSQQELVDILNGALTKKYSSGTVSAWENGNRSIPDSVLSFAEALVIDQAFPAADPPVAGVTGGDGGGSDTAPPGPDVPPGVPFSSSGVYKKACTELWEIIAAGVGMCGAAIGSDRVMLDGAIIAADKEALGDAWGKLAETNETFRNMLVGMTSGGAWLQVCVVTGTTVGKLWNNHAQPTQGGLYGVPNGHEPHSPDAA